FLCHGAYIPGSGQTVIVPAATVTVPASTYAFLVNTRALTNQGAINAQSGSTIWLNYGGGSSGFTNAGSLSFADNTSLQCNGGCGQSWFQNTGTDRKGGVEGQKDNH